MLLLIASNRAAVALSCTSRGAVLASLSALDISAVLHHMTTRGAREWRPDIGDVVHRALEPQKESTCGGEVGQDTVNRQPQPTHMRQRLLVG